MRVARRLMLSAYIIRNAWVGGVPAPSSQCSCRLSSLNGLAGQVEDFAASDFRFGCVCLTEAMEGDLRATTAPTGALRQQKDAYRRGIARTNFDPLHTPSHGREPGIAVSVPQCPAKPCDKGAKVLNCVLDLCLSDGQTLKFSRSKPEVLTLFAEVVKPLRDQVTGLWGHAVEQRRDCGIDPLAIDT